MTTPRIFAHRGSSGLLPENTRSSFLRALDDGADGIELDVHLTADGEAVCFHDFTVDRTTDGQGAVADHTIDELRRLDATSWKLHQLPPQYSGTQIMSLTEVLNLVAGRGIELAIELKHPSPYGRALDDEVLAVLAENGYDSVSSSMGSTAISLMSFDPTALEHLSKAIPSSALCALWTTTPGDPKSKHAEATMNLMRDGIAGIAGPSMQWCLSNPEQVRRDSAEGLGFRVWTVDEVSDARRLVSLGVREVTGNFPHRLISAFRDR